MADKKKPTNEEGRNKEPYKVNITAGGEPLPIDPDTGEIDASKLTEAQRANLHATFNKLFDATDALQGTFTKAVENFKKLAYSIAIDETGRNVLSEMVKDLKPLQEFWEELSSLEPFIKAELKKEEYGGLSFDDFLDSHTLHSLYEEAQDETTLTGKVFAAARAAKEQAERVTITHADNIEYPLDKISGKAWSLLEHDTGGQLVINFEMLPKKPNLQATAYYSINFDDLGNNLKITKRLLPFDKRVYIAVSALFNAGNDVVTATQIYYAMGGTGKPSQNQIEKIDNALSKMTGAKIMLDNEQEAAALKGKYPHFKYDGALLPMERITAIVNGQVVESAIHIFREPPLMTFAKERKQVTTIDVALLQSPVNKTDANLLIDDYLIERISREKNGKRNTCRILYKTLFDHAKITTRNQKARAPEKIKKYLDYYQQQGFITRYTEQADGITIYF